jgi:UDP-GlcNAc:undecaprenyl-phosphate GlcNAc-1-phosphate transferase
VSLLSIPLGGVIIGSPRMSLILTVLVVLVTINAVNFVDGLDGLAAGVVSIGGAAFFAYSYSLAVDATPDSYANLASLIIAVLVGACVGFLPHNFNPSRIFMGDSGSMLIGLLLAASTIRVTGQVDPALLADERAFAAFLPIILPIAVMALPLLDLGLAVVRRMMAGRSPRTRSTCTTACCVWGTRTRAPCCSSTCGPRSSRSGPSRSCSSRRPACCRCSRDSSS